MATAEIKLELSPHAPAAARKLAREVAGEVFDPARVNDFVLATSEVVSASVHEGSADWIHVRLSSYPRVLVGAIDSRSTNWTEDEEFRGIYLAHSLLDAACSRWRANALPTGLYVWFWVRADQPAAG
ncbi:MAG TPA: hypothetical protein VKA89_04750 [Solirubrobacterales bacterium]|nr:hypothetical protein [Solirubrobacterales bacterium]